MQWTFFLLEFVFIVFHIGPIFLIQGLLDYSGS